jgi:hypothetical protein
MGYSLYIDLNTFVESDKVSIEGITLPSLRNTIRINQTLLDLDGWEFGEEFGEEFDNDSGDIEKEDVLRLYTRWCEITDNEIEQEFVDIINNAQYGFQHGNQYFTYSQSY